MTRLLIRLGLAGFFCFWAPAHLSVQAAETSSAPAGPQGTDLPSEAPQDAVMASPEAVAQMHQWGKNAFAGTAGPSGLLGMGVPFSFQYGGRPSTDLLGSWQRSATAASEKGCDRQQVSWTDPATGLRVRAVVTAWRRYPAVEWVLYFKNEGAKDTPILENVQALDVQMTTANAHQPVVLHQIVGDVCGERSFLPQESLLPAGQRIAMAPGGGRSSNGTFPFFTLQYGDQGVIAAVGWSGQWAASLTRDKQGPTRLQAGMEKTHLVLHPGEEIRTPRILLLNWKGDRQLAQNRFRRLMLFHYVPKRQDRPVRLPIAMQCFDRYFGRRPDWKTEAGQIAAVQMTRQAGCDAHWLDAAWFELGFPNGVGNWYPDPRNFPRGLKPVGEACHKARLDFILWYEPERVAANTRLVREHPEYVFPGGGSRLFKLGDPAARRWLTDLLSSQIAEFGIDVYRNDFNIDPLSFWRAADTADRQGITEIRYVEGLYAMWDELRARHPGLWIDNCASGGRRIDLETCMRSVPLWRSDTSCGGGHADWDQTQTQGLSLYVPLFTACAWTTNAYVTRSAATAGLICQFDYLSKDFVLPQAQAATAEARENRKYWYGDFYPLTRASIAKDVWAAYQFHRADLDAGLVLAFRRAESNYPCLQVALRALAPKQRYQVEFIDEARQSRQETLTGQQLSQQRELRLDKASSLVIRYLKAAP